MAPQANVSMKALCVPNFPLRSPLRKKDYKMLSSRFLRPFFPQPHSHPKAGEASKRGAQKTFETILTCQREKSSLTISPFQSHKPTHHYPDPSSPFVSENHISERIHRSSFHCSLAVCSTYSPFHTRTHVEFLRASSSSFLRRLIS